MPFRINVLWWLSLLSVLLIAAVELTQLAGSARQLGWALGVVGALGGLIGIAWRQRQGRTAAHNLRQSWKRLEHRERELSEKLSVYHEWLEFPVGLETADNPSSWKRLDQQLAADRRLDAILLEATESIYEKIRTNYYAPDGRVDAQRVRQDAWALAEQVARLYHPDLPAPLMEASPELLLRALQRAMLQLLVLSEQLPLDVRSRSVQELYAYVRKAVSAFGVYQSARPFLPWLSRAYYLGRFAMGGNPITLGAWWLLGTLGTQGAQAAATRLFHRQALQWLYSVVRVIGTEAASIYGGDYRLRDPNWMYATELTDLLRRLPPSAADLQLALNEVGGLPLRSEYDRLFLYRCLAARASARPERFAAAHVLTPKSRRQVAQRLQQFCSRLPEAPPEALRGWQTDATQRLDVQLRSVSTTTDSEAARPPVETAAETLAGYVLDVKNGEPEHLPAMLGPTHTWRQLTEQQRAALTEQWREAPPFLFGFPAIAHDAPEAAVLLDDLVLLAASISPYDPEMEHAAASLAAYLQRDPDAFLNQLGQRLVAELARRTRTPLPRRTTPDAARAILNYLGSDNDAVAVFHPVSLEGDLGGSKAADASWLVADEQGLILIWVQGTGEPTALWTCAWKEVRARTSLNWLHASCHLEGGELLTPVQLSAVRVSRTRLTDRRAWDALQQHLPQH